MLYVVQLDSATVHVILCRPAHSVHHCRQFNNISFLVQSAMFIPWWGLIRWMFFSTILAPCSSRSFFPLINLHQTQTRSKELVELISLDKHLGEGCKLPMNWGFTQIHTSPKALWDTYNKGHRLNQENKLLHEWHQNSSTCQPWCKTILTRDHPSFSFTTTSSQTSCDALILPCSEHLTKDHPSLKTTSVGVFRTGFQDIFSHSLKTS